MNVAVVCVDSLLISLFARRLIKHVINSVTLQPASLI